MIRIQKLVPLPDFILEVVFEDGKHVWYDVKEDMNLPEYNALRDVYGLFQQVCLDESRTCVYWNDVIDLPSDILYAYGKEVFSLQEMGKKEVDIDL